MTNRSPLIIPRHQSIRLAELVGVKSQSYLSKILHGKVRPSWELAIAIDMTGMVPFSLLHRDYPDPKITKRKKAPCKP